MTHPWPILLSLGVVLFVLWALGSRSQPHHLKAFFAQTPGLYAGEDVQIEGVNVGKVSSVVYSDGKSLVTLGFNDGPDWPFHAGTQAVLRFGTTIGNGTRYVEIVPGPSTAPALPEFGVIHARSAVEFDQILNVFDARTRAGLRGAFRSLGQVVGDRSAQIADGVDQTGPALGSLAGFTGDLAADGAALRSVVANGNLVTAAMASRSTEIENLVSGAASTFQALGGNAPGISASLSRLTPALVQVRSTLGRLDTSIGHLHTLVTDLAPGAARLVPLSAVLRPALGDLRTTIPVADATFATAIGAAPQITALLREARPFAPPAAQALTSLTPMVQCIAPYSPEIAGVLSTWTSFTAPFDNTSHMGRIEPQAGLTSVDSTPITPAAFMSAAGPAGATYALVRPPGYNAGQPSFMPQCDYTQKFLNPADDPEVNVP